MKTYPYKALFLISCLLASTAAAQNLTVRPERQRGVPFGGRVIAVEIPSVSCSNTYGTAPVVLSSNLAGLISAGRSAADGNLQTSDRVVNTAQGIYKSIPLYTMGTIEGSIEPKVGDWVLGLHRPAPDARTCKLRAGKIELPFPVMQTQVYSTSR